MVFLNSFFNAANADLCSSVMLSCASLRMRLHRGAHSSANHGLYRFKKLMSPRNECMVSLSFGNSILKIESIFLGSGVISCEFHRCPKKCTSCFLNCSFDLLRTNPFFLVGSKNWSRFLSCSSLLFPKMIISSVIPVTPGNPM